MYKKIFIFIPLLIGLFCTQSFSHRLPNTINLDSQGLYPEGIAYDYFQNVFFVTSLNYGNVVKVYPEGHNEIFIDDQQFVSSIGIKVDAKRNRLIVANGDPGLGEKSSDETRGLLAGVGIYDLQTGERIDYIDLAQLAPGLPHFANDIVLDYKGNIYITDSFSSFVFKINTDHTASILVNDPRLGSPIGTFGLNGIVYNRRGYLLVAKYFDGTLYKIPLHDPYSFTEVFIANKEFPTIDGMLLKRNGKVLELVSNNLVPSGILDAVYQLESHDNWNTAEIKDKFETGDIFPTTLTRARGRTYVINSKINNLFSGINTDNLFPILKVKY